MTSPMCFFFKFHVDPLVSFAFIANLNFMTRTPKGTPLRKNASFEPLIVKIHPVRAVRRMPEMKSRYTTNQPTNQPGKEMKKSH